MNPLARASVLPVPCTKRITITFPFPPRSPPRCSAPSAPPFSLSVATKLECASPSTAESKITTGIPASTALCTIFFCARRFSGASAMPSTPRLIMFSMILFCSAISVSVTVPSQRIDTPCASAAARAPSSTVSQNSLPVLLGMTPRVIAASSVPAPSVSERVEGDSPPEHAGRRGATRAANRIARGCFMVGSDGSPLL